METENEFLSLREQSIAWWKSLESPTKLKYWEEYREFSPSHSPDDLTGREIQNIYAVKTTDIKEA